jgi:hypothetical protein
MPMFSIEESLNLLVVFAGLYMLSESLTAVFNNYHKIESIFYTEIKIEDISSEQGNNSQEETSSDSESETETETEYEESRKPHADIQKSLEKIPTLF